MTKYFNLLFHIILALVSTKCSNIDLQTCIDNFNVHRDKIIRTQDSQNMGAKYLNEIDLGSREECLRLCCETDDCDVFVFEEKNSGSCYLFHCGPPEDFKCKFTHHVNYSSAVLSINRHLPDLESQIKLTKHVQDLTKLRKSEMEASSDYLRFGIAHKSADEVADVLSHPFLSVITSPPSSPTTTTTLLPIINKEILPLVMEQQSPEVRKCSRYQFECHSTGECIAIYNACDGIPQCADGSDEAHELGCPAPEAVAASSALQTTTTNIPALTRKLILESQIKHQQNNDGRTAAAAAAAAAQFNRENDLMQPSEMKINQRPSPFILPNHHQQQPPPPAAAAALPPQSDPPFSSPYHQPPHPIIPENPQLPRSSFLTSQGQSASNFLHPISNYNDGQQQQYVDPLIPISRYNNWDNNQHQERQQQQQQLNSIQQINSYQDRYSHVNKVNLAPQNNDASKLTYLSQLSYPQFEDKLPVNYYPNDNNNYYPNDNNNYYKKSMLQQQQQQENLAIDESSRYILQPSFHAADTTQAEQSKNQNPASLSAAKSFTHETNNKIQTNSKHTQEKLAHDLKHSKDNMEHGEKKVIIKNSGNDIKKTTTSHLKQQPSHTVFEKNQDIVGIKLLNDNIDAEDGLSHIPRGAILSLSIGLLITAIMAILIGCRLRVVRRRMRKGGGKNGYAYDADYLVNGMYL